MDDELEGLLRQVARAPDARLPVVHGTRIGRFEIVKRIGQGGMGAVYEANDPTLGRRVAIKLLASGAGEDAAARMLREAQALARLSHPNVVTIYDAGRDDDRVYLAMELVDGETARAWRAAAPRTVREILDVYRQAAAGLAAAHRAGLVHRDVKPDNILVGTDGRVRVTDFGLAAAMGEVARGEIPDGAIDPLSRTLTETGTVLGTPPYMPPEAYERREIDARSDQWSLCVSLWETLASERPFVGQTVRELAEAVRAGRYDIERASIPSRLRPALVRGLAVDPDARWPSVDALMAALGRRRVPVAGIAAGTVSIAGVAVVLAWPRGSPAPAQAIAPPPPVPVQRTHGGCPYMPAFVDDTTIVFDDGNGDLYVIRGDAAPAPLVTNPDRSDWRANRGRRPGEAVFTASGGDGNAAGFVDVATGAVELLSIDSGSFAAGGGALFYTRTDVPQVRRVLDGEDAPLFQLPDGLWPYTVAASADGRRVAVTTATDRSSPTVCLGDTSERALDCLDRDDVIRGRAAFSPDGGTLYYQTRDGIRRRSVDGGDDVLWLPGVEALGGIDVSPSGRTLIFSDDRPRGGEAAPLDALDAPVVEGAACAPSFGGGRWFYTRETAAGLELVAKSPGGAVVVLAALAGRTGGLWVDATGGRVAYDLDGDAPGIYVVDTKPFPPVRVTLTAADSNPVWTRDGKLVFTRWDDAGQPRLVIADPALGTQDDATRPAVHPSPRVTLARVPTTGEIVLSGLEPVLYLWDPDTGAERVVDAKALGARGILQATVAPDGSAIVVLTSAGDAYELWRVPLTDGGAVERVLEQPDCGSLDRPAFDADGTLHAVIAPWRGDIYTVDLQ